MAFHFSSRIPAFLRRPSWQITLIIALFCAVILEFRYPFPHWIDAYGSAAAVQEGRHVVHPPGYWGFLLTIRLLAPFFGTPFAAMQAFSILCAVGSIFLLFSSIRPMVSEARAVGLAFVYAFSWILLLTSTIGTSHPIDLLNGALLTRVIVEPNFWRGKMAWSWAFGLTLAFTGFFRLPTLVLWAPLVAFVIFRLRKSPALWVGLVLTGMLLGIIQMIVIDAYGGWKLYQSSVDQINEANAGSSLFKSGLTRQAALNVARALFWFVLTAGFFLLWWKKIPALLRSPSEPEERPILIALVLAILGPLIVFVFYITTHPAYMCVLAAPLYALAAVLSKSVSVLSFRRIALGTCLASLLLFYIPRPFAAPSTPAQALANGLFLQYTRFGIRSGILKTVSTWLYDIGYAQLLPPSRLKRVEELKEKNARE